MALADSLRSAAHAGISTLGGSNSVTLVHRTVTQNTLSGATTVSSTRTTVKSAQFGYKAEDVDGTNVLMGDRKFYLSGTDLLTAGVIPTEDDTVEDGTRSWRIIRLLENKPDVSDNALYWVAQCRQEGS